AVTRWRRCTIASRATSPRRCKPLAPAISGWRSIRTRRGCFACSKADTSCRQVAAARPRQYPSCGRAEKEKSMDDAKREPGADSAEAKPRRPQPVLDLKATEVAGEAAPETPPDPSDPPESPDPPQRSDAGPQPAAAQ